MPTSTVSLCAQKYVELVAHTIRDEFLCRALPTSPHLESDRLYQMPTNENLGLGLTYQLTRGY